MLVLTRKLQEKIRIGDDITITVLKLKGKSVRLGIEAPAKVPVARGELPAPSVPPTTEEEVPSHTCPPSPASSRSAGDCQSRASHWPAADDGRRRSRPPQHVRGDRCSPPVVAAPAGERSRAAVPPLAGMMAARSADA